MKDNRYIAAIEISSSKVIGAVGRIDTQGHLHVVAIEQEKTLESVKHGIIQNMLETTNSVNAVLRRLESRPSVSPRKIKSVYLGISGRSLCNIVTEVTQNLPDEIEITPDIIDNLKEEARNSAIDRSLKTVDVVPRIFYVNDREIKSPIGTVGHRVRASVNLLVCRLPLVRNAVNVLKERVKIGIDGIIVTPVATANLVLSSEDKRMGCMLVDMGAETTTVSIYKNGYLEYLATLPMGSRNITRDITSLSIVEEKAENIKISSAHAKEGIIGPSLSIEGIQSKDLTRIVTSRCEEIVYNIIQQKNYANLNNTSLGAGIVTVGGGFRLNRLNELLQEKSRLKVRNAILPSNIDLEDTKVQAYESIEVISILNAAVSMNANESLEEFVPEELPPTGNPDDLPGDDLPAEEQPQSPTKPAKPSKTSRFLERMRASVTKIFENQEDDDEDSAFNDY